MVIFYKLNIIKFFFLKVLNAVEKTMRNGTSFGAPTRLENELAELILTNNPSPYLSQIQYVHTCAMLRNAMRCHAAPRIASRAVGAGGAVQ